MKLVDKTCFVDTNILIYATIAESPFHAEAKHQLETLELQGYSLWISRQVIREFLAVLSRSQTFSPPIPANHLVKTVRAFEKRFSIAEEGVEVTTILLELIENYAVGGKQVHDANLVATMLANRVTCLLTYNRSDFERFTEKIHLLAI